MINGYYDYKQYIISKATEYERNNGYSIKQAIKACDDNSCIKPKDVVAYHSLFSILFKLDYRYENGDVLNFEDINSEWEDDITVVYINKDRKTVDVGEKYSAVNLCGLDIINV